jgi:hypothetical protein
MKRRFIKVNFEVPGFHAWPSAPTHRSYLRKPHRHLFKVTVTIEVKHGDRAIEFHDLLDFCFKWFTSRCVALYPTPFEMNRVGQGEAMLSRSCETMAEILLDRLVESDDEGTPLFWPQARSASVEVSEDGECSGLVTWRRD